MSERQERLKRKLTAANPQINRLSCSSCPWWGLSLVNMRCPDCGGRTH